MSCTGVVVNRPLVVVHRRKGACPSEQHASRMFGGKITQQQVVTRCRACSRLCSSGTNIELRPLAGSVSGHCRDLNELHVQGLHDLGSH
jgi:hypothetical protein